LIRLSASELLTPADLRNLDKRRDYEKAVAAMLRHTSTAHAPWIPIAAEDKRYARLAAMDAVIGSFRPALPPPPDGLDPDLAQLARQHGLSVPKR